MEPPALHVMSESQQLLFSCHRQRERKRLSASSCLLLSTFAFDHHISYALIDTENLADFEISVDYLYCNAALLTLSAQCKVELDSIIPLIDSILFPGLTRCLLLAVTPPEWRQSTLKRKIPVNTGTYSSLCKLITLAFTAACKLLALCSKQIISCLLLASKHLNVVIVS